LTRSVRRAAVGGIPAAAMLVLLSATVWPRETVPPSAGASAAASRDAERCRSRAILDACYDAIRRSPRDPALLVALGDALEHSNRPAEALRAYRRAAALTPNNHGIAAKISALEAKQLSKRAPKSPSVPGAAVRGAGGQPPSNADPVTKSH
jgi:cytochrome c-type biogenesis protein CcmH/NrfG